MDKAVANLTSLKFSFINIIASFLQSLISNFVHSLSETRRSSASQSIPRLWSKTDDTQIGHFQGLLSEQRHARGDKLVRAPRTGGKISSPPYSTAARSYNGNFRDNNLE